MPFVVKDLDGLVADEPFTGSCRFLQDFVPDHDSTIITRMRRAGVILVAKSNTPEFGIMGTTEPELRGPTHNPWSLAHTPGGSSGGSGALVAARAVPMAHAGDGGGSIRIPASICGLFGMKPTRGRNPVGPDTGEGWGGYVQPHVLTRSVRDSAAMLDALCGPEAGAPYATATPERSFLEAAGGPPGRLRVAWSPKALYGNHTHPDCVAAVEDAARLCEELGHHVEEAAPAVDTELLARAYLVQVAVGVSATIAQSGVWVGKKPTPDGFEPPTWLLGQIGSKLSALELHNSREACHEAGRQLAAFHTGFDVFLCPTAAHPPALLGQQQLKGHERLGLAVLRQLSTKGVLDRVLADLAERSLALTPNTQLFNQTGQPAMSVPLFWNDAGLPIGVQFAGRFGDEATLFALAAQLECARPWADRRPGVCA